MEKFHSRIDLVMILEIAIRSTARSGRLLAGSGEGKEWALSFADLTQSLGLLQ